MRARRPPTFERVVAAGASQVVPGAGGDELRIYGSIEEAMRGSVGPETAERLFKHMAGSGEPLDFGPLCAVSNDESVVTCDSRGCPGECILESVPANWKWSDPPPRREPRVAIREAGRIYFCMCDPR